MSSFFAIILLCIAYIAIGNAYPIFGEVDGEEVHSPLYSGFGIIF